MSGNGTKSMTELLRDLDGNEDKDIEFVLAATINLYAEALRRVHGRVLLAPNDVRRILDMAHAMLMQAGDVATFTQTGRDRQLSDAEKAELLNAVLPEART